MAFTVPHHDLRLLYVGNVCTQWAWIEYQFAMAIWSILGLDEETGKIVTGGLDMLPRANMAINLAEHLKADRALTTALRNTRRAIQAGLDVRRNRAVHGVSFAHPAAADVLVEVHRGPGGRSRSPLPREDLKVLADEIHALGKQLDQVLHACGVVDSAGRFIAPVIARKTAESRSPSNSQPSS